MRTIREVLVNQVEKNADLQNLADACGEDPTRPPPRQASVKKARLAIAKVLGLSNKRAQLNHTASPWKWKLVQAIQKRTQDPDIAVGEWLEKGVPFGIAQPIIPGGLLPTIVEQATLSADDLFDQTLFDDNHRSFREVVDGSQPALDELQGLVDAGFARICSDLDEAETFLGRRP